MIHITIPGKPIPMARPRVIPYITRIHGYPRARARAHNPVRMRHYEHYARIEGMAQYKGSPIHDKPVSLVIKIYRPIPKSLSNKKRHVLNSKLCIKKPDCDNYVKSIIDAFIGVLYEDDNLVAHIDAWKRYSFKPRIEFYCRTLR